MQKALRYAATCLILIVISGVVFVRNSSSELSIRLRNSFLPCHDFDPIAWSKFGKEDRYALACGNLCDQILSKSANDVLGILGEPDVKESDSRWYYEVIAGVTFKDALIVHFESNQVSSCFFRD
jgi:hypothetical protein